MTEQHQTNKTMLWIAKRTFNLAMALLWPVRWTGVFGSKRRPNYYQAGARVPFWVYLIYPSSLVETKFALQAKVWFEWRTASMHVQALEPGPYFIELGGREDKVLNISGVLLVGAPTILITFDGTRMPSTYAELALQRT